MVEGGRRAPSGVRARALSLGLLTRDTTAVVAAGLLLAAVATPVLGRRRRPALGEVVLGAVPLGVSVLWPCSAGVVWPGATGFMRAGSEAYLQSVLVVPGLPRSWRIVVTVPVTGPWFLAAAAQIARPFEWEITVGSAALGRRVAPG